MHIKPVDSFCLEYHEACLSYNLSTLRIYMGKDSLNYYIKEMASFLIMNFALVLKNFCALLLFQYIIDVNVQECIMHMVQ